MEHSAFWTLAVALAVICALLRWYTADGDKVVTSPQYRQFQFNYLLVFLLAMFSDWMQGPYVYALYEHYNFGMEDIALLFIAGFGSSLLLGTPIASLADKFGRRKFSLLYCVLYAGSCVTKHFNSFPVLLLGRVLGGVSTSLLFSVFESWLVFEHNKHKYPQEWLSQTFTYATLGNGITAIVAGVVAYLVKQWFGFVAPFDTSFVSLCICLYLIATTWGENFGNSDSDVGGTFSAAVQVLRSDIKVSLVGVAQSFFEGSMYTFVFMWTPTLGRLVDNIPHGLLFASFMIAVMIGSTLFGLLMRDFAVESFARFMYVAAIASFLIPIFSSSAWMIVLAFLLFEACVGVFWPAIGTIRSKYVPEETRSTLMNFFRVPLNIIVLVILRFADKTNPATVFGLCVMMLTVALIACSMLHSIVSLEKRNAEVDNADSDPQEMQATK